MKTVTGLLATVAFSAGLPAFAGDCPAAVLSAVEKAHAGAKTLACKNESDNGATLYEVKIRAADGKKLELEILPDGEILVTEEHIAPSELPASVLQGIHSKYPDAKIAEAERVTADNGEISFEVEFTSGGRKQEMTLTEAGAVVELEDDDEEDKGADEDD